MNNCYNCKHSLLENNNIYCQGVNILFTIKKNVAKRECPAHDPIRKYKNQLDYCLNNGNCDTCPYIETCREFDYEEKEIDLYLYKLYEDVYSEEYIGDYPADE